MRLIPHEVIHQFRNKWNITPIRVLWLALGRITLWKWCNAVFD